jgi:hypothetical protein
MAKVTSVHQRQPRDFEISLFLQHSEADFGHCSDRLCRVINVICIILHKLRRGFAENLQHGRCVGVKQRHAVREFCANGRLVVVVQTLTAHCSAIIAEVVLYGGRFHL